MVIDVYQYTMDLPYFPAAGEGSDDSVTGDQWSWTLGQTQYNWLQQTLENSNARYKFVLSHQVTGEATSYGRGGVSAAPYFEWGGLNEDGTWGWDTERPAAEGWDVPIHQLMVDNRVSAYIQGHDHIYAYERLDGIVYLEVPKPDDAGYDWEPYGYGYNEDLYPDAIEILQNSGHIWVMVSPTEAVFDYVRSYLPGDGINGEVAHSFTILPGPKGDVSGDGDVSLQDLVVVLKIIAGNPVTGVNLGGDIDNDGKIGVAEAIYIMRRLAGTP